MKKLLSKLLLGKIVYTLKTNASFEKVMKELEKAIKNNNFSIPEIHDLKKTYKKANLPLKKDFEYKIVQLCNAKKSYKALTDLSYDLGIMMPKNIIVSTENGKTALRFMKMKPWMVSMMFPEINIVPLAKGVTTILEKIVTETIEAVEK